MKPLIYPQRAFFLSGPVAALALAAVLTACGQIGPLYMPRPPAAPAPLPVAPLPVSTPVSTPVPLPEPVPNMSVVPSAPANPGAFK